MQVTEKAENKELHSGSPHTAWSTYVSSWRLRALLFYKLLKSRRAFLLIPLAEYGIMQLVFQRWRIFRKVWTSLSRSPPSVLFRFLTAPANAHRDQPGGSQMCPGEGPVWPPAPVAAHRKPELISVEVSLNPPSDCLNSASFKDYDPHPLKKAKREISSFPTMSLHSTR